MVQKSRYRDALIVMSRQEPFCFVITFLWAFSDVPSSLQMFFQTQKSPARGRASHTDGCCKAHLQSRWRKLILFLANLLAIPLACKCFLDALLLAGLQVKGVTLHFLDDVFLLHLALEAAECVLEGFTLLETYFCQCKNTPLSGHDGQISGYRKTTRNARSAERSLGRAAAAEPKSVTPNCAILPV
jgi:hypothetical protein